MTSHTGAPDLILNLSDITLFEAIQLSNIFDDSKTFNDCIPKFLEGEILSIFEVQKSDPNFVLRDFVYDHFIIPADHVDDYVSDSNKPIGQHIQDLWAVLTRNPDEEIGGSLIPLPNPYVVPGGRFQEVYYWDSYFTMLGLQVSGRVDLMENIVDNFAYLIGRLGFVPNGNRTYYIGRSQPPFFALMIQLLCEERGEQMLTKYLPFLETEYAFWMHGEDQLDESTPTFARVVRLADGSVLNRYWDTFDTPRPESYREDIELVRGVSRNHQDMYRHIRAAAESGWDFSSRWLADIFNMESIHTTDIIPVDLNCLMLNMERTLRQGFLVLGELDKVDEFDKRIEKRENAIRTFCWDHSAGFFFDYDFVKACITPVYSLAAVYPLFFKVATVPQAVRVEIILKERFLQQGGLVTTPYITGQQWDAPNGWAPLQWMGYKGLRNYGFLTVAALVKNNWLEANKNVYEASGKMTEKYDVTDRGEAAGGGEYPNQDGFGWTNGVYLKLASENFVLLGEV